MSNNIPMASFQASVINPVTGSTDVQALNNCTSLIVQDDSNYTNTDPGHSPADFKNFRVFQIQYYQGSIFTASSVASPPTAVTPSTGTQSASLNIITGDGFYIYILWTVPTWNSGSIAYTANNMQVYNPTDGNIYTCITNNTSSASNRPDLSPANWRLVPSTSYATGLLSKYVASGYFALTCNVNAVLPQFVSNALCSAPNFPCNNTTFCNNPAFLDAAKLMMLIYAAQTANNLNQLSQTTNIWNLINTLTGCTPGT